VKVGIDTSPLRLTRAGTARYVHNLLRRLESAEGVEVVPLAFGGRRKLSTLAREAVWYPLVLAARARGLDVLHCPTYYGPFAAAPPLVVTVHDLAVWRYPEAFPRWTRTVVPRTAARVIAVSEFTKRELVEVLGVPAGKIRVVPNAVDEIFTQDGPRADGEYVLAVGTLEPRKNLARAAEAARRAGFELRVAGARGWGGVTADGWVGEVSDDELARLYRGARCVVYASLYEGFGIPVLEAMACGVPVVTSRGGATEEVADGAAVAVDPLDVESLAAGIGEAVARGDELRARGVERARTFSWDEVARRTLEVYREVA
jgi:glycosyltransferase involved in cell wall biosynthesis